MIEIWLPIPGYADIYEVSNHGNVRSYWKPGPQRMLRETPTNLKFVLRDGYHFVSLVNAEKQATQRSVASLVLETFVGPRPEGMVVCHRNDIAKDNYLDNLEYGTSQLNSDQSCWNGLTPQGVEVYNAKLTDEAVRTMRKLYATGEYTYKDLGRMYGTGLTTAHKAINRITWKHVN